MACSLGGRADVPAENRGALLESYGAITPRGRPGRLPPSSGGSGQTEHGAHGSHERGLDDADGAVGGDGGEERLTSAASAESAQGRAAS